MATDILTAMMHLLAARKDRTWISALPTGARPQTMAEAYAVQKAVAEHLGPIVGWKVGASTPQAMPQGAPLHADTVFKDGISLPATMFNVIGVEAEVGYVMARDLPPRDEPYAAEEVLDAIGSMNPFIEIADTRFTGLGVSEKLSHFADQSGHGALVVGPGLDHFRHLDVATLPMKLIINGKIADEKTGALNCGDPVRLIQWLADEGAVPYGGLKAGHVITTGSWNGCPLFSAPLDITVSFEGLGSVSMKID
ncbi:fumarylacetoacetate hydrolase family protein [Acetobacteraceae bacterium H6797]|nr:fumarylacetoacetate hydrolase family protein [Acetobacteraceae bacterium H6797]